MTKPVSIAISINTSWNICHFRAPLINHLRQHGFRVYSAAPPDAYTSRLTTLVDGHVDLPMDNDGTSVVRDLQLWLRYLFLLRKLRPDILLTYTIKPNIYGTLAARILGIPVIANVSGLGTSFIHPSWITRIVSGLYRQAFKARALVFFQNSEDRDLFVARRLVDASKTRVIPGSGIDTDFFSPRARPQISDDGGIHFVLIARLLWDKGIGEYVEAAQRIKQQFPQSRFRLLGPRGVRNQSAIADSVIDAWMREGKIEYLGETDDVREVIASHDCVVLPSYREGLPRTLLEAAAMAKPMIATDVPGCRQLVIDHENGLLCRPHSAQDLARAMMEFITLSYEERVRMGEAARHRVVMYYDEKKVFSAYSDAIATLTSV